MHRTVVAVLVLVAGAGGVAAQEPETVECEFPITVTDATGEAVTVEEEPERVVVLAPSAAQTMWELGAEEKVVGMPVNEYTSSLNGSRERTDVVGADGRPVQSRVVALEADLVLAPNVVTNDTVRSLRRADQTVYRFRGARSLGDLYDKTELTGRLVGEFENAARVTAEMRGTAAAVERAVEGRERPDVYYVLGGGWTAGENTFIDDLVATAGGRNVAAEANITSYKQMSPEVVAERDPDWIVLPEGTPLPRNPAINGTTAVREGQIVSVDANDVNQPAPRTMIPLRRMAESFHPDATIDTTDAETPPPTRCEGAVAGTPTSSDRSEGTTTDPTAGTPTTTVTTATQPADGTPTPTSTPGAGGPGFTAALALVALAAVSLFAREP